MRRLLLVATLLLSSWKTQAQSVPAPRYMQIFYEGAGWLAGRPLLHFSPALRGKANEVVQEAESTKSVSPGAFMDGQPAAETVATVDKDGHQTTYVRGKDRKMHLQPPTSEKQEAAQQERFLNLLDARAALARNALTAALNTAAADGWEVVQMSQWGGKDGLVYLLRHR